MNQPVLELRSAQVRYGDVVALDDADLACHPGEALAVTGRSGSGKSTLLSVLSLLRRPTAGEVLVRGRPTAAMPEVERSAMRARTVGVVFQSFHLERTLTIEENVMLPWRFAMADLSREAARARARSLLEALEIPHLADRRPHQVSGGERQRAATARALLPEPAVLLADEPTGNLDEDTAGRIGRLLADIPGRTGCAAVVVTHDLQLAALFPRRVQLARGRLRQAP